MVYINDDYMENIDVMITKLLNNIIRLAMPCSAPCEKDSNMIKSLTYT